MKYIRLKGEPTIILFPDWMSHKSAANDREVSSAGFVDTVNWICHGESVSLGVQANPDSDNAILKNMIKPLAETA